MQEIEQKWIVRKCIGVNAIKSKIFYSEEAALDFAQERTGLRWIKVEAYIVRYGVEQQHRVVFSWYNPFFYEWARKG